jgi:hypothetical protein
MLTLIQAQERYIERVNRCEFPKRRGNAVRRAAGRQLSEYLTKIGVPDAQQGAIIRDAWDMAELERNTED